MNRRSFLRAATGAAGATLLRPDGVWGNTSTPADLLLRGALVYDGTGAPPFEADVAVAADRIAAVGRKLGVAGEVFDLRGLALAPGFIDIHSHTDRALLVNARADSKVRQGVTTEVAGQDGSSMGPWTDERLARIQSEFRDAWGIRIDFRDLGGFFTRLEAQPPAVNLASMVGAGTVRGYVIGEEDRPATDEELARMVALVEQALQQGACGLSSGLEYVPGASATREELVALAVPLRGTGLPYASHIRNEEDGLFGAIEEALHVGRRAGVPVQVSHLKAQGRRNWWKAAPALGMLESARAAGVDVAFDCYPYVAYSTDLGGLFPVWARLGGTSAFLARLEDAALRPRIEAAVRDKVERLGSWDAVQITQARSPALSWATGRRLGELAAERGMEPYELLVWIIREDRDRTGMVGFGMSEENVARMLAHPLGMVCSDGGAQAPYGPLAQGSPHPRAYGAFPRVLGRYVRELKALTLEAAIHKMSGMPAARLRLADRGRIAPGAFADLVVFDPSSVADRATFENPHQYPVGIPHVLVNGRFVVRDGEHTGVLPGRVLRCARAPS